MQIFSIGNMKINKNTAIWSLPQIKTCKPGLQCHKYCYSNKRPFKSVIESREAKYQLSLRDDFVDIINKELKRLKNIDVIRVHENGDAYSVEYIYKWYAIAKANPTKTFYEYTKRDDLYTADVLKDKPSNFVLIYSYDGIDPDISDSQKWLDIGFDKICYITKTVGAGSCFKGKMDEGYCMKACRKCIGKNFNKIALELH